MRKVVQITDDLGAPISGHVFEAPDAESLAASMADLPPGCWHEVASEADLVVVEAPFLNPVDEPGQTGTAPETVNI